MQLYPDDRNTSWNVISFDQASLGLTREYLIKGFDDDNVQVYYKFMVETAVLLGADEQGKILQNSLCRLSTDGFN